MSTATQPEHRAPLGPGLWNRIGTGLGWIENGIAAGSLGAAALLQIISVVLRNTTGDVIFWSEEATIYLIIYSTFFGAVVVLRHNEHVNVDILAVFLRGRAKKFVIVLGGLVTLVYAFFIGIVSWQLIAEPFSVRTITPALKLPLWTVELSVAIGMTLFLIRALEMFVRALRASESDLEKDVLAEEAAAAGLDADLVEEGMRALRGDDASAANRSDTSATGADADEGDATGGKEVDR